jgi:murein L,D-transpeptidase YcbB/YkuD
MLSEGCQGEAVKAVQTKLHLAPTGIFDRPLTLAVEQFQEAHPECAGVDGIVGPKTAAALGV